MFQQAGPAREQANTKSFRVRVPMINEWPCPGIKERLKKMVHPGEEREFADKASRMTTPSD